MTDSVLNEKIQFTKSGLAEIKAELEELKGAKLTAAIERVARARDFGDLSENAEYHAAKEELSFIEGRIEELEGIVARAEVVGSKNKKGTIDIGCKVTVTLGGKEHTYEIVGEWEADPLKKKISHTSPLGQALVGKKMGENVVFTAPAGKVIYKIKKIH
ncbi:transcription elongation factor GreA [Candidatus Woesebacteria bacterium]|nr:transcription elongation factor GreA [Candidatus Woesebacteria bacterium]